ncbi:MAG: hypothetical protein HXX14_15280 [Bacteroidetes bacterium]|nr:hypothetical protein [Bacteroidota bacterium]
MNTKLILKSVLTAVIWILLDLLYSLIAGSTINITHYGWGLLPNILVLTTLGYYITHSTLNGMKLSLASFAILYGIGYFNILNEALIFNVTNRNETINILLKGFFIVLIVIPLFIYLLNNRVSETINLKFKSRSIFSWIWRIILCDILYLIFYITAGMILQKVYPEFMTFYKDKVPPFSLIINTQFFRGFIFIGIALLILRTMNSSLTKKAVLIGLTFSIFGGIAPLIQPNEYMPGYVRIGHLFEVGISNFLYGLVLGYLLGQKTINEKIATENTNE